MSAEEHPQEHIQEHIQEHPKHRPLEAEDPLMLQADCVDGSPDLMLACLVEEYAHAGWERDAILKLFDDPFFRATSGLKQLLGEQALIERVDAVLARCGVIRCTFHEPVAMTGSTTLTEESDV